MHLACWSCCLAFLATTVWDQDFGLVVSGVEQAQPEESPLPVAVGHRGMVQTHPENTLPGFEACLRAKVSFELDVRRTRDGRLVVLHDATLDRTTTGTGLVADATFDEIRKLDAGS